MDLLEESLATLLKRYPTPPERIQCPLRFGTAGFRDDARYLDRPMVIAGFISAVLSGFTNKLVGICITASHNLEADNGVKIIEPDGSMLQEKFEILADSLSRSDTDSQSTSTEMIAIVKQFDLKVDHHGKFLCCPGIITGYDTRSHSIKFLEIVKETVRTCSNANIINYGLVTTPALHWLVYEKNRSSPDVLNVQTYIETFTRKLAKLTADSSVHKNNGEKNRFLFCDAAGGVGCFYLEHFAPAFRDYLHLDLVIENKPGSRPLNFECGADFAQKEKVCTLGKNGMFQGAGLSLDGDADRLIVFQSDVNIKNDSSRDMFDLFDGDQIQCAFVDDIISLMRSCIRKVSTRPLTFGIIQTAYANGSSTKWLHSKILDLARSLEEGSSQDQPSIQSSVHITKTGVKFLISKANEFDIAVYFESNGHGSVVYCKDRVVEWLSQVSGDDDKGEKLLNYLEMFNPSIGDAIVNSMVFFSRPRQHYFTPLNVVQSKVRLAREFLNVLKSEPSYEGWLLEPPRLQKEIDDILQSYSRKSSSPVRAFVRKSGTEDICRVYCEASTLAEAESLCGIIEEVLHAFASEFNRCL